MKRVFVTLGILAALLLPHTFASAELPPIPMKISGIVWDLWGRPQAGATVGDGAQVVVADDQGRYELSELQFGCYSVTASSKGTDRMTKQVCLSAQGYLLNGPPQADFSLPYKIRTAWQDPYISTISGTQQRTVGVVTGAPDPGVPEEAGRSCVYVTDNRTSETALASFLESDTSSASWQHLLEVSQDSPEDIHELSYWAQDCSTGQLLSRIRSTEYRIDNTPPQVFDPSPQFSDGSGPIGVKTRDLGVSASLLDFTTSELYVDGVMVERPYWGEFLTPCCSWNALAIYGWMDGIAPGVHQADAIIRDRAGNLTELTFTFEVEQNAPILNDHAPSGVIGDHSPRIEVQASDDLSGISVPSISMKLTDGLRSATLPASYDPMTDTISYQVPEGFEGTRLGGSPLIDGSYQVTVVVSDVAGNTASVSWSFVVDTLTG